MTSVQNIIPNIGVDERTTKATAEILCQLFSDQMALELKTWNLSYNVVGPRFTQVSTLLKEQTCILNGLTTCTSVQIRNIGHRVPSVTEVLRMATIESPKSDFIDEETIFHTLLKDHETILQFLMREQERLCTQVKEYVIEDFLIDVVKKHRKMAWVLRSHLEKIEPSRDTRRSTYGSSSNWQEGGYGKQGYGKHSQMGYGQETFGKQGLGRYGQEKRGIYGQEPSSWGQQSYGKQSQMGQEPYGYGKQSQMGQDWGQENYGKQSQMGQEPYGYGKQSQMGQEPSSWGQENYGKMGQYGQQGLSPSRNYDPNFDQNMGMSPSRGWSQESEQTGFGIRQNYPFSK